MPAPFLYLDECVDSLLVAQLEQRGFTATSVQDQAQASVKDEEVLAYAVQRGGAVLTHNKRHFQRLHREYEQRGHVHHGILIVPQSPLPRVEIRAAMLVHWIATQPQPPSPLFLWNDLQYGLTRGLRLPGFTEAEVRPAIGQQSPY